MKNASAGHISFASKIYAIFIAWLLLVCISAPARADDNDPFQMDTGRWMSFGRYKEYIQRGLIPQEKTVNGNPATANAAPTTPPEKDDTTGATPVIAAPTRPLTLPVMPGVIKGYNVQVDSTLDDKQSPIAKVVDMDGQPDLHLQAQNWLSAAEAARDAARAKAAGQTNGDDRTPLNVRMSFLPDRKITPIPDPEHKSTHIRETAATPVIHSAEELKALPADLAACVAAVDAYKKKQLEAIQSDRQTLAALQDAIAQLGLQKQLGFITDTKGNITAETQDTLAKSTASEAPPSIIHP
jgi:hypothetical protein